MTFYFSTFRTDHQTKKKSISLHNIYTFAPTDHTSDSCAHPHPPRALSAIPTSSPRDAMKNALLCTTLLLVLTGPSLAASRRPSSSKIRTAFTALPAPAEYARHSPDGQRITLTDAKTLAKMVDVSFEENSSYATIYNKLSVQVESLTEPSGPDQDTCDETHTKSLRTTWLMLVRFFKRDPMKKGVVQRPGSALAIFNHMLGVEGESPVPVLLLMGIFILGVMVILRAQVPVVAPAATPAPGHAPVVLAHAPPPADKVLDIRIIKFKGGLTKTTITYQRPDGSTYISYSDCYD